MFIYLIQYTIGVTFKTQLVLSHIGDEYKFVKELKKKFKETEPDKKFELYRLENKEYMSI